MQPAELHTVGLTPALYERMDRGAQREYHHFVGRGVGMGAELIGIMKGMLHCLAESYRFVLTVRRPPRGWLVPGGWPAFFTPHFAVRSSRARDAFNRARFPADSLLHEGWRTLARRLLDDSRHRGRWMFDPWGPLPASLPLADLECDLPFPQACQWLLDVIWDLRDDVRARVNATKEQLNLPAGYLAVHVRRGDKRTESPDVPIRRFTDEIRALTPATSAVVVATDDARVVAELAAELGSGWQVTSMADGSLGYDQAEFNQRSAEARFAAAIRFMAEVEAMREAQHFVGAASTNVACLVQYFRAFQNVTLV